MKASRLAVVVGCALITASCGHSVETAMPGTWGLATINGEKIPIALPAAPEPRIIREAVLLLFPDGEYTYDYWIEVNEGRRVRSEGVSGEGTWKRDGDDVHLTDRSTGTTAFGTVYGTSLRVIFGTDIHDFVLILQDPTVWQRGGT